MNHPDETMNGNNDGKTMKSPRPPPLPLSDRPGIPFPAFDIGIANPFSAMQTSKRPENNFKKLKVTIGCERDVDDDENSGNKKKKKKFPVMVKVINDIGLTVEDWLQNFLSVDVTNESLAYLFHGQNEITTTLSDDTIVPLTFSLGPNRSMQVEIAAGKNGMICNKHFSNNDLNRKKRKREARPISVKIQLITSSMGFVLCPRDPIFHLIDSGELLTLRLDGKGTYESQVFENGNQNHQSNNAAQVESETFKPESPPAKRRKVQRQSQTPQPSDQQQRTNISTKVNQQANGSIAKRKIINKQEKKKSEAQTPQPPNEEGKSSSNFSDQDVLLGDGPELSQNPGNINYNKTIRSKAREYATFSNEKNKKNVIDGIKNSFRFHRKGKKTGPWRGLAIRSASMKIKKDLQREAMEITQKESEQEIHQKNPQISYSQHKSEKERINSSINDGEKARKTPSSEDGGSDKSTKEGESAKTTSSPQNSDDEVDGTTEEREHVSPQNAENDVLSDETPLNYEGISGRSPEDEPSEDESSDDEPSSGDESDDDDDSSNDSSHVSSSKAELEENKINDSRKLSDFPEASKDAVSTAVDRDDNDDSDEDRNDIDNNDVKNGDKDDDTDNDEDPEDGDDPGNSISKSDKIGNENKNEDETPIEQEKNNSAKASTKGDENIKSTLKSVAKKIDFTESDHNSENSNKGSSSKPESSPSNEDSSDSDSEDSDTSSTSSSSSSSSSDDSSSSSEDDSSSSSSSESENQQTLPSKSEPSEIISNQKRSPPSISTKRIRKRKPLLDPNQKIHFPDMD